MRICIVDDQPIVLQTLATFLSSLRHEVTCCESVGELEEFLEESSSTSMDAVITDLQLPGISAPRLVRRVRELFPGTPIIVISGHWKALMSVQDAVDNDVFAFLDKPFSLVELEFLLLRISKCRQKSHTRP